MTQRGSVAARDRVMRVFVSSTFRDMEAERNDLATRVFPKLRELCEQRGVVWGEVDLRWGVTSEELAEGRVLPICLEEIHDCRPYFVGLLGDRYGSVLNEIPQDLVEREPWLIDYTGCSITELEILHGALNEPSRCEHAIFYFRDSAYINRLPPGEGRNAYAPESPDAALRLVDLKRRIRESGYPVCDGYKSPQELGDRVLADLTAVLDLRFPTREEEPLNREARRHQAFQEQAVSGYVAGERYSARLEEHLAGNGPPLVVTGPSGSGKSALLAHWVTAIEAGNYDPVAPGGVVAHYAAASPGGSYWPRALERVTLELARRGRTQLAALPSDHTQLPHLFESVLKQTTAQSRMAVVLDGVDELDIGDFSALSWLPATLPVDARLIVSTGSGPGLEVLRARGWPVIELQPLSLDERRHFVTRFLATYRKRLAKPLVELIASAERTSNPLYMRTLLEELRVTGRHEELEQKIASYLQEPDLPSLLDRVLRRYEEDFERDRPHLVGEALSLIWAARAGLQEIELRDLMGNGEEKLPEAHWSPLRIATRHFFVSRRGLLTFAYAAFREAVERRYLPTQKHRLRVHEQLADYFLHRLEKLSPMGSNMWLMAAAGKPIYDYRRAEEVPFQLASAERWEKLAAMLTEFFFLDTAWRSNPNDVRKWWSQIESASAIRRNDAYRQAIEDPSTFGPVLIPICLLLQEGGFPDQALLVAEGAERFWRLGGAHGSARQAAALHAKVLSDLCRFEEASKEMQSLESEERSAGNSCSLAQMLITRSAVEVARGAVEAGSTALQEAAALAAEAGDIGLEAAALSNLAVVKRELGYEDESLSLLQRAEPLIRLLGDLPQLATCFGTQARIQESRGDLFAALALYERAEGIYRQLGYKEGLRVPLQNRAEVCRKLGRLDEALLLLAEKEKLCRDGNDSPGLARSLGLQAQILLASDEPDAAFAKLEEEEALWRNVGGDEAVRGSLRNIVDVLLEANKPERVLDVVQWRIQRATDGEESLLAELHFLEGSVLAQELGNTEGGLSALDKARDLFNRGGLADHVKMVSRLQEKIRSPGAQSAPSPFLPSSEEAQALLLQAMSFQNKGDMGQAIQLLNRGLQFEPGNLELLHQRGVCFYRKGQFDQARTDFSAAIAADPDHYGNWLMRGFAELSLGRFDAALSDGEQALTRDPNVADAHMLVALALGARASRRGWLQGRARREDIRRGLEHFDHALQCGYSRFENIRDAVHLNPLRSEPGFVKILEKHTPTV